MTTAAVVIAQTFVSMPFLVLTVEAALRQLDPRYEDAARTLGASRWHAFRRVTLPTIRPALISSKRVPNLVVVPRDALGPPTTGPVTLLEAVGRVGVPTLRSGGRGRLSGVLSDRACVGS